VALERVDASDSQLVREEGGYFYVEADKLALRAKTRKEADRLNTKEK
jgi:hypothetical protein